MLDAPHQLRTMVAVGSKGDGQHGGEAEGGVDADLLPSIFYPLQVLEGVLTIDLARYPPFLGTKQVYMSFISRG